MEKTLRIHLKELREKIADDIISRCDCEKSSCESCDCGGCDSSVCIHERLAAVARGSQE